MQTQVVFTAYPITKDQINALKSLAKALKIEFEVTKENPYYPDFVNMVLESEQEIKDGKFKVIKTEDLWK